ncbi:MAG: PLD nuclease N-terminal domain-containing protein [Bacilli bacterium]
MPDLLEFLPVIIPLAIIQFGLMIFAVLDVLKRPKTKNLNQVIWLLIAIFVSMMGPILYFTIGRGELDEDGTEDE